MSLNINTGIFIDRAINELRTGRPIIIEEKGKYWIFYNIEHAKKNIINQFKKIQEKETFLLITQHQTKNQYRLLIMETEHHVQLQLALNFCN